MEGSKYYLICVYNHCFETCNIHVLFYYIRYCPLSVLVNMTLLYLLYGKLITILFIHEHLYHMYSFESVLRVCVQVEVQMMYSAHIKGYAELFVKAHKS